MCYWCSLFEVCTGRFAVADCKIVGGLSENKQTMKKRDDKMRFSSSLLFISIMNETDTARSNNIRACLHGGGGPQIGEVTCGGSPHLSC